MGLLLCGPACIPGEGWQRTDARTCTPRAPARLCIDARPDRALVARTGALALVPGECADAPAAHATGTVRIELEDGERRVRRRIVHLPRGRVTTLALDGDRARVRSDRCTVSP